MLADVTKTPVPPAARCTPFGSGLNPGSGTLAGLRDRLLPHAIERLWDLGLRDLHVTRRGL